MNGERTPQDWLLLLAVALVGSAALLAVVWALGAFVVSGWQGTLPGWVQRLMALAVPAALLGLGAWVYRTVRTRSE